MILAIDFDGVIHNPYTGEALPGARDGISRLREAGYQVWIHSCNDPAYIEKWLNNQDIRFDYIVTGKKPVADLYIDDHGYHFQSWQQALQDIPKFGPRLSTGSKAVSLT